MSKLLSIGFLISWPARVMLAIVAGCWAWAPTASAQVYRCPGGEAGVLYTDTACPGGSAVEIKPSAADPAAVERLARIRATLERSADRRLAELNREFQRKAEAERQLQQNFVQTVPMGSYGDAGALSGSYYDSGGYAYAFLPRRLGHPGQRLRPPAAAHGFTKRIAPPAPYAVPRPGPSPRGATH